MNATAFHFGQQVVLAEDGWWGKQLPCVPKLKVGKVYEVQATKHDKVKGRVFLRLVGHRQDRRMGEDDFWPAEAFRLASPEELQHKGKQAKQAKPVPATPRPPGRLIVELDDLASAMLRQAMQGQADGVPSGTHDPRDVVSAAVTYMCSGASPRHAKYDLNDSWDCIARAKAERKRLERKAVA